MQNKQQLEQVLKLKLKYCFTVMEKHPDNIALQMAAINSANKTIALLDAQPGGVKCAN